MIIITMITSVSNFSFAADSVPPTTAEIEVAYCEAQSSICGTAPAEFTALLDFTREMMNSMKTIGTKWDYLGKYVNPNRFKGNIFEPPPQNVIDRVARNVSQKIKFGLASTAIFSSPVNRAGVKDVAGWTVLLAKNKIFLRDTKLVQDMESLLATKKTELGLWAWWYETVRSENLAIMNRIVDTYVEKWVLLESSHLNEGVRYNNVTSLLTKLLSSLKDFLYVGSMAKLNEVSRGWEDGIKITFNPDAIKTITDNYACAWYPNYICSTESKKIGKMATVLKKSVADAKVAGKTFTDARKRLWKIFAENPGEDFTARENDLLRSMYGTTQVSQGTGLKGLFIDPFKKTLNSAKKSWAEVVDQVADVWRETAKFRQFPNNPKEMVNFNWAPSIPSSTQNTFNSNKDTFTALMNGYIGDVFASQKADSELANFSEVKDITPAFTILGKQIASIKNDVLGGKDRDGSLIKGLWEACELQCGGWGKWCRQ